MTSHFEESQFRLLDENKALIAEVEALKSKVNHLKAEGTKANTILWDVTSKYTNNTDHRYNTVKCCQPWISAIVKTPEQCLNSVKASAVQAFANRYCGDCTTEYETKLNDDANEWAYSVEVTGEK